MERITQFQLAQEIKKYGIDSWEIDGVPAYLSEGYHMQAMARNRTGSEYPGNRYWLEEKN